MRVTRSLLLVVLSACGAAPNIPGGPGPIGPTLPIALKINADTLIQQSQGIKALSVPGPAWVFIVQSGVLVCEVQETASGGAFPHTISIAGLPFDARGSIDVIALPSTAASTQKLDSGCYASPTPDGCALCIACSQSYGGMGCCVKPPGTPPTAPKPCSF
jgi:hypothetical protein